MDKSDSYTITFQTRNGYDVLQTINSLKDQELKYGVFVRDEADEQGRNITVAGIRLAIGDIAFARIGTNEGRQRTLMLLGLLAFNKEQLKDLMDLRGPQETWMYIGLVLDALAGDMDYIEPPVTNYDDSASMVLSSLR